MVYTRYDTESLDLVGKLRIPAIHSLAKQNNGYDKIKQTLNYRTVTDLYQLDVATAVILQNGTDFDTQNPT